MAAMLRRGSDGRSGEGFGSVSTVTFVAVICALAALVFAVLWWRSRGAEAARTSELGEARAATGRVEGERDEARERIEELTIELDETSQRLDDAIDQADADAEVAAKALAEAEGEIETLTGRLGETSEAVETATAELEARSTEVIDLTHRTEQLAADLEAAEERANRRRETEVPEVLVDAAGGDQPFDPAMAWRLELVRSERTWRYSVATNPMEDPSPFDEADDALKLAIEIESLALREDVGAFIGIEWEADGAIDADADPARAHLTLRIAQEMLAAAAREMEPSKLIVRRDEERGGIAMQIVAVDAGDVDFRIPPPPIASEWIDIDEHGGMVVTVKPG